MSIQSDFTGKCTESTEEELPVKTLDLPEKPATTGDRIWTYISGIKLKHLKFISLHKQKANKIKGLKLNPQILFLLSFLFQYQQER